MNQPRHDLYTAIHKALRSRLFQTVSMVESCDFSEPAERDAALTHVRDTLAFLEEHAGHEDEFVMPRIANANASLAERLEAAHARVEQSGANVAGLVAAIAAASPEVAVGRGPELCHAVNVLVSEHFEHMNEEETLANATLWQAHSDDELRQLQGELQATIPPERMGQWMSIMLPALNVHERIGVMTGMKAGAPPEAFQGIMGLGRQVVGSDWQVVEAAVA